MLICNACHSASVLYFLEEAQIMENKNFVITIGREYGSGGRLIGRILAEKLGVDFYDKELITLAAEKSGLSEDFLNKHDQSKSKLAFLQNAFISTKTLPLPEQIYQAQCKVIQEVAAKGSCVIVGRCADHVLAENPRCVKVFIHAPQEEKVNRIIKYYHEDIENPAAYAAKIDRDRAAHYNYFTLGQWGDLANYNLTVDSSVGVENAAEIIRQYAEIYLNK